MKLRVAKIVARTEAQGPGLRLAIWTQGCPIHCAGCCNPEMLDPRGGSDRDVEALICAVQSAAKVGEVTAEITKNPSDDRVPGVRRTAISGVTLLGGEPFAQARSAAALAAAVQALRLSVAVFTGYHLETLRRHPDPSVAALLVATDLLFAGPYQRDRPERRRRWIGSSNQVVHFLTARYRPDDPCFVAANTVELRLRGAALEVNGWPSVADAVCTGDG